VVISRALVQDPDLCSYEPTAFGPEKPVEVIGIIKKAVKAGRLPQS
jgi:hypothetical protein